MIRNAFEVQLCIAFTKHCEQHFPRQIGILNWTHIANEGRSKQQGDKLKKMGVRAGWFDYEFIYWDDNRYWIGFLEAKVDGRDFSATQNAFRMVVEPMGIPCEKFYSVREGHEYLLSWNVKPLIPCQYFKEPVYLSKEQKLKQAQEWFKPC